MSESYVCPKCNSTKFIGYDDASGAECRDCGHFIPDNELDDYAYVKIKKSELARRDEIITRLKEDAERLATGYEQISREAVPYCVVCKKDAFSGYLGQIKHDDWCPITLHRALMKELE